MSTGDGGFALYVHWPFCRSKCPYCDFNSHVREQIDQARWAKALRREIAHFAEETRRRTLTSVFFGGGTPSLMEPSTVAAVIDAAAEAWSLDPAIEITLEANPTSVEAERFEGYRSAGVGRVSLGVQALDDADLKALGRQHDVAEAVAAVDLAARIFPRFSFDLIYARPGQTTEAWAAELDRALGIAGGHLSLYQLTIEEGTAFHARVRRGELIMPDEDTQAALYEATQQRMAAAGLPAYEISNHARPGEESRHNLTYWRYGDYVGVGPGAHGRLTEGGAKWGTRTHRAPEIWLDRVESLGHAEHEREAVGAEARLAETLMMGLRLAEGVPIARIEREAGRPLAEAIPPARIERLVRAGMIERRPDRIVATPEGRQRLDAVLAALLA